MSDSDLCGTNWRGLSAMMWTTYPDTSKRTVAFLPCGHSWRNMMALRNRGGIWHYDFAIDGRRFRGSTREKIHSKARLIETHLMNEAKQRRLTVHRRTLTLAELSKRFLGWVKLARL